MDVHTLINGLTAEVKQLKTDMADAQAAIGELSKTVAAMAKPEPEKHPKKGHD